MRVKYNFDKDTALAYNQPGYTRAQKRRLAKQLHLSKEVIDKLAKPEILDVQLDTLPEGLEVKLNVDRILENTKDKSEYYINFVKENRDTVFTVFQDEAHKGSNLYCLNEDPAEDGAKWLFDISDLIPSLDISGDLDVNSDFDVDEGADITVTTESTDN